MGPYSIGVDLGGTNLRAAAVDENGKVLERVSVPANYDAGPINVVNEIVQAIRKVRDRLDPVLLRGVGIGAAVFGVNGDDAASHARFIAKFGLTMPLLTDPGLAVAKAYDAVLGLGPLKIVNRTVVGIDRAGRVAFYERGMPATAKVLAALASPA